MFWSSKQSCIERYTQAQTCSQKERETVYCVTRGNFPCSGVALQVARKTSSCDTPCLQLVSQRKIALQVAEKVETASIHFAMLVCDTHCNLSRNCFEKEPITIRHNQNAADIFKYSAGVKYNLIAGRKTSCDMLRRQMYFSLLLYIYPNTNRLTLFICFSWRHLE